MCNTCCLHCAVDARSVHLKLEDYTVHDVANTVKRYMRNLRSPVVTTELYAEWLAASRKLNSIVVAKL